MVLQRPETLRGGSHGGVNLEFAKHAKLLLTMPLSFLLAELESRRLRREA
jgi:uncharacterized membrane protein